MRYLGGKSRLWKKEKRIGLRQSAQEGWNTSEIPEGQTVVAKFDMGWGPEIGRRRSDEFHAERCSWPIENTIGWIELPGKDL